MPSRESAETGPAVANIPDKCRAIEQAIQLATTNRIKIDGTEEFGNLKSRLYEFFQQNRVIKDLYPYSFFERDNHHSTSGLLKAIPLAKARLTATHENARILLDGIAPLMAKAKKIQNVGIDKREAKRQALTMIEADRTGEFSIQTDQHIATIVPTVTGWGEHSALVTHPQKYSPTHYGYLRLRVIQMLFTPWFYNSICLARKQQRRMRSMNF
jgi:hypothetical protein